VHNWKTRFFNVKKEYTNKIRSKYSSKDYGLKSQRTIKYRPTKTTFREYGKKVMNFYPGLKYWQLVLNNDHEWNRQDPVLSTRVLPANVKRIKQTVDH
jgi:hypothetical protein